MSKWISVKDAEEIPLGAWLGYLEVKTLGTRFHVVRVRKINNGNLTLVGGNFSFDMPRVTAYQPLPKPPEKE